MQIRDSKILILGGWGLVGSAICRELMKREPAQIIISSLRKDEAEEACEALRKEYKDSGPDTFVPKWGNIFAREEWKDDNWNEVLSNSQSRKEAIDDIFGQLDESILRKAALYKLIDESKPDIVIDCINTATAIAYQNVYKTVGHTLAGIEKKDLTDETVEKMISSMYLPQLIRHVQIMHKSLIETDVKGYLKVGTAGTGGMGLNIPYTHSEERPSRMLLSKAAVAGAQSLLMFLMARTPDGPIVKEIKPTAAIAWKKIAYDEVAKKGRPIKLCDLTPDEAYDVNEGFRFEDDGRIKKSDEIMKSVYIDTGENGIFSRNEFRAIGSLKQMEIVTAEEIAELAVYEIEGGNTGKDIVQGLDSFSMGPTYRAGMMYNSAIEKLEALEKKHGVDSVAFEILGPPRLSKLLFEANILKKISNSMKDLVNYSPDDLAKKAEELMKSNEKLRSEILSVGLPILLSDGKKYLRGEQVAVPTGCAEKIEMTAEKIEKWTKEGWIDLRPKNFELWKQRLEKIIEQAREIPENETSSRFSYTKDYWSDFEKIDEGKLGAWIFEFEDEGWRWKR